MNEQSIFTAALELEPPRRNAFLDDACGADEALRRRMEKLLQFHDAGGDRLQPPREFVDVTLEWSLAERPGTVIGPYKLLEQIGEGGMGVVFRAEQTRPVQRTVALKIIKPGMDSRQVIARFEAERQALAMMDHPNIAKVLDAGMVGAASRAAPDAMPHDDPEGPARLAGPTGRPFFVMELVQGVPITEYCDQCNLTTRERIGLFITVCHAVQHAHQKGVIHRDIKPTNVLVAMQDGQPAPKIIDFGVAKAINQRLTEDSLATGLAQIIGTPLYMSPEQAELSPLGVDTRSDIYSLGVLLYELLTGTTPFDKDRMQAANYDEFRRIIREEEPVQPSARISTFAADLATTVAERRRIDRRRLLQTVRGDLDWIVMKCLDKDRNRRYESASSLSADITRYLNDEPVTAGPPSTAYRLRKLLRRNRGPALAACATLFVLICGVIGTTWGMIRAEQQRRLAELSAQQAIASAEAEKAAKMVAQAREAETKAALDFVQHRIFAAAQPVGMAGGLGRDVSLRQAVEAALPFVEEGFGDLPLVEGALRNTLGISLMHLGEPGLASEQFQAARAIFSKHAGSDHHGTLASMNNLAASFNASGQYAEAIQLHEQTLELRRAQLGPDHPETLETINNLAIGYCNAGRYREALPLFEQTLAMRKVKLGPEHRLTLDSMNNLATVYNLMGHYADASKLYEQTLELRKTVLGPHHPDTLTNMNNLANSYGVLTRYDDAIELYEHALDLQEKILGLDHPHTFACLNNLAISYGRLGRYDEAHQLYLQAVGPLRSKLGPEHSWTLMLMCNLANSHRRLGQHDEAMALYNETLTKQKRALGPDHPDTLRTMTGLAISYSELGRHAEALALNEETLSLRKAKLGGDHPDTLLSMSNTARVYGDLGRNSDALALHEQTLSLQKSKLGPDHPDVLNSMQYVSEQLVKLGRGDEAVPIIDECVERASGKMVDAGLIPAVLDLRLQHFQTTHDVPGCLETADRFDALERTDAASLYQSAYFRAVCATEIQHAEASAHLDAMAREQSNQAMVWLRKAVDAGFTDIPMLNKDKRLDALRDREDFRALIVEMEHKAESTNHKPAVPVELQQHEL